MSSSTSGRVWCTWGEDCTLRGRARPRCTLFPTETTPLPTPGVWEGERPLTRAPWGSWSPPLAAKGLPRRASGRGGRAASAAEFVEAAGSRLPGRLPWSPGGKTCCTAPVLPAVGAAVTRGVRPAVPVPPSCSFPAMLSSRFEAAAAAARDSAARAAAAAADVLRTV